MQTLKVEVQDALLEKILCLLNSFSGVKVKNLSSHEVFLDDIKSSECDILEGRVSPIEDIDVHIQNLKNEII